MANIAMTDVWRGLASSALVSAVLSAAACAKTSVAARPTPIQTAEVNRPAAIHAASLVILAHTHDIQKLEFDKGLLGGVSGMGLDIVAGDGQEHVNRCRQPREPSQMYDIYDRNLAQLSAIVAASGNKYRIASTVRDIRDAKQAGALAIIVGTEAADHVVRLTAAYPSPADVRAGVQERYKTGWRKSHLFYPPVAEKAATPDCPNPHGRGSSELYWARLEKTLSQQGTALIQEMNRTGVLIDVTHAPLELIAQLLDGRPGESDERNNAPIASLHESPSDPPHAPYLASIAASGGGYGVIGYHFLSNLPGGPQNGTVATVVAAMKALKNVVGADHIVLGGDYYTGPYEFAPASMARMGDLTQEFVAQGFTDDEIRKILGGNMLTAYERAWDPTRGYSGGPARFYQCTNASTSTECLAARSHYGQGDFNHRPVSCLNAAAAGAVNLELTFRNGAWSSWSVAGTLVPCTDGSLLAVSWGDGAPNGQLGHCDNDSTSPLCTLASTYDGSGSLSARAINCLSPAGQGAIGLHIPYVNGKWKYYNLDAALNDCTPGSLLAVRWGGNARGSAKVQLCDDRGSDAADERANPICVEAAANGGSGTSVARALSCYNSTADFSALGAVGLQLTYQNGRWQYYNIARGLHPCVHGSVLVARN